jgi:hypothetical protein
VGLHGAAARRDDPGPSHRPLPAPEAESAWSRSLTAIGVLAIVGLLAADLAIMLTRRGQARLRSG